MCCQFLDSVLFGKGAKEDKYVTEREWGEGCGEAV